MTTRRRVLRIPLFIVNSMMILPLGCVVALIWANTGPESYYRFSHAMDFWINDVAIVFFFGIVTIEVVEATLTGGVLHPWKRAALPVAAAIGAVAVPIAIYFWQLNFLEEHMLKAGWPAACAVDIAACYLVGGLIFGKHPAVPFMLLLAISANAMGLAVIAALEPAGVIHVAYGLALVGVAMLLAAAMRHMRVRSFWPYILVPGAISWFGLHFGGVHPSIALLPIVPFMPHARTDAGFFADRSPTAHDALSNFGRFWALPVQGVLFLFGLVNAGVPFYGLEEGMFALPIATMIGRPIGVLIAVELAVLAGLHKTLRLGWRDIFVIGCVSSIGFAFALFSGTALFETGPLQMQTKTGALLTSAGALWAVGAAWVLGVGRFNRTPPQPKGT